MSTTFLKKETLERKWYVIDAAGKPLGRTAVEAANLLRGKHKVDFTPNVDCGDYVIVINTDKAVDDRQQAGSEELLPCVRLDRRSEGNQGSYHDGEPLRLRYGAGCQGHAAQEHPGS